LGKVNFLGQSDLKILHGKAELLNWFRQNKRDLPFRNSKNPYLIWVSEVMLQQTRMNSVLPLYEKFIKKFPDIQSLANSRDEEVLSSWRGLGYYSRALNLKKGAEFVVEKFGGVMPSQLKSLLEIPGIGPYTARAISSIAFGKQHAVLDGNVKRVIARIFLFEKPVQSQESAKKLQEFADMFLNEDFPGDHNEAMMELGASLCGRNPECGACPLSEICLSRKNRREMLIPVAIKDKRKVFLELHFLLLKSQKKILLLKDKKRRFFETIFTPPYLIIGNQLPTGYTNEKSISEIFHSKKRKEFSPVAKHSITHHNITLRVSEIEVDEKFSVAETEAKWVRRSAIEKEFPSSIAGKLVRIISA